MLHDIKYLLEKWFKQKPLLPIYKGIVKRQRRSFRRDEITKFGDPISKYSKYN